jgi:hypothetical protein
VNSQNATGKKDQDAVIAELETLLNPDNQPRERKFDFTKDYVVWNMLANQLYKRRTYEAAGSDARRDYLVRAARAGETVLALEAEDVQAHDLLMRVYAELAGDRPTSAPAPAELMTADDASARAATAADPKQPADQRTRACSDLVAGVPGMALPRLGAIKEAIAKLGPAFHAEADPEVRSSLAATLTVLHRESHAIYKPDDNAQANATRIYRGAHPEANYVSRARVIYPTAPEHRQAILATGDLPPVK